MQDQGIRYDATLEAMAGLKKIAADGLLTAAIASQICDGASGVVIANEAGLKKLGRAPLARIHQMAVMGGDPVVMLETPIEATRRALAKARMPPSDEHHERSHACQDGVRSYARRIAEDFYAR